MKTRLIRSSLIIVGVLVIAWLVLVLMVRPSNERDWEHDQERLATAEIDGDRVTVRNIRNFTYRSTSDYDPAWYDRTFDLGQLDRAWFVVEPFGSFEGAAHTFVTFGFADRDYLAISIEIRKERGEEFSALAGLARQYEIMYVIGDERDLIGLRANHRQDEVFLYPVKATREQIRAMFIGMLQRANELAGSPEFYNTLTNTCTTNLVRHVNDITPGRIPPSPAILFPGYSDRLAFDLGLIDTDLPFERIRERYRINDLAMEHAGAPDFSRRIREPHGKQVTDSTPAALDPRKTPRPSDAQGNCAITVAVTSSA